MITMAYQTLQEFNKTGIDNVFLYVATSVPSFVPLFLFSVFMIVILGTYYGTKRFTGQGDFFSSMSVASFLVVIIASLMTLKDGLIDAYTLSICIVVAIISVILLFFTRTERG